MDREAGDGLKSPQLPLEQEKEVVLRCLQVIDYVTEVATNIIIDFVQNLPCLEAKKILLKSPEGIALRCIEQALNQLVCANNRPKGPIH